jgi:DNA polymerase-1
MGADILGVTYEQAKAWRKFPKDSPEYKRVDDARQLGKVANFGFPGGLGAEKLVLWGRKTYNVIITVERARMLKQEWLRSWPEMNAYFRYVNALIERGNGLAEVEVPISGFLRGGAQYCAACNTSFQSLGASAAGRGVWHVQKACYRDRSSVLFGSRTVNFVHDEMLVEVPDDSLAHERALELEKLMCKGANELLPDVPATAPPMLMRYWSKNAYAMYDNGRLIPWAG